MPAFENLPFLLGEIRRLTGRCKAGGPAAFDAFHELVTFLLTNTILSPFGAVRMNHGPRADTKYLGGWRAVTDPLPLRDGRFLRLAMTVYLDADTGWLKIASSNFQYQVTADNSSWVFRYDYSRTPPDPEPAAHLQIRGSLTENALPDDTGLQDVQFPTNRVSLEAVIRVLVEGFRVPCDGWQDVWRRVLAESERPFLEMAHRPLSGPP